MLGYAMRFDDLASEGSECVLHPVAPVILHGRDDTGDAQYFHASGAVCNLPMLAHAAGLSGFMNAAPDADGILRRAPLLIELDGRVYPSLALAATMAATGARAWCCRSRRQYRALIVDDYRAARRRAMHCCAIVNEANVPVLSAADVIAVASRRER